VEAAAAEEATEAISCFQQIKACSNVVWFIATERLKIDFSERRLSENRTTFI